MTEKKHSGKQTSTVRGGLRAKEKCSSYVADEKLVLSDADWWTL